MTTLTGTAGPEALEPYVVQLGPSVGSELPREIRVVEGNGAAHVDSDRAPTFAEAMADIDSLVASGGIGKRDRKARFDGCALRRVGNSTFAELRVGPTHYEACMGDIRNHQEAHRRAALGRARHGDPCRYLACGLGVLLLPTTTDGRVLLGVRAGEVHHGQIHGPAGWLPFRRRVERIDPVGHALTECDEELGLVSLQPPELLGVASDRITYETDLVFTARAADGVLEDMVERRTWARAPDAHEHADVMLLTPRQALEPSPPPLRRYVPSTRFGLQALLSLGAHPRPESDATARQRPRSSTEEGDSS